MDTMPSYGTSYPGSYQPQQQQGGGMNMQGLGSLMQFIPGFMNLMKGMNNTGQKNTAAQMQNVTNAMGNTNNPLYQQLYGGFKQQGQQQLGENITQMEGQNRNLAGMGRTPLFDPSRQGEMAFRAQAAAGPQMGMMAQQETQGALGNMAKALGGAGGQVGVNQQLFQNQYGARAGNNYQTGMGGALNSQNALGGLGAFLNTGGQRQQMGGQVQQGQQQQVGQQSSPFAFLSGIGGGVNAPGAQQGNTNWFGGNNGYP